MTFTIDDLKRDIEERVFKRTSPELAIVRRGAYEYNDASWLFDFRAVVFDAKWLECFARIFWEKYASQYPFQVGGMESASLPLITAIALKGLERGTPVHSFFIRKSRKRDGLMRMFEGSMSDDPVIIVDDAINSGQSLYRKLLALFELKKKVTDVFVILGFRDLSSYGFLREHNVQASSIFTVQDFGLPMQSTDAPDVPKNSFNVKWRFRGGKPSFNFITEKSAPVIDSSHVFVGSDDGYLYALHQSSGDVAWKFVIGPHPKGKGIFSSPAVYKGRVYFGGYDGNVYALDAKTGERLWGFAEADWVGSSPSIAPDVGLLFIGLEYSLPARRGGIVALRLDNGEKVWGHRTREFTHASPLYIQEENMVVIGSDDNIAYAYEARTGKLAWTYPTRGAIKSSFAYDAKRRLILFSSWDGRLYAVHAADGSPAFSFLTSTPTFSTPLVHGDTVFFSSLDKFLYAIDLDTGLPRWHFLTHGRIFSSPVVADGSVWIGSNDGRLYELDPETGLLRSFFQSVERIVNAIAFNSSTKRFFVPTVANEVFCLERSSPEHL